MFCRICSGALSGVCAYLVSVEVDIDKGLPAFSMVGLLGSEVRESRERVCVALKNAGMDIPPAHITVNLSPADRRKEGTAFDLPIAIGVLKALGHFAGRETDHILFLGELGLNGEIKKVRGVLPIVREAAAKGIRECIIPKANVMEGAVIPGITVRGAENIREVAEFMSSPQEETEILPAVTIEAQELLSEEAYGTEKDFSQIRGQENARRAALIAAAGFHNLLMSGPPGAGKSMIARRIPGILPRLELEESLEVTSVYSVAGLLKEGEGLMVHRPFQAPHHTVTQSALIGGSFIPKPGIISLAHRGVLFLDELPEFTRVILDGMRQPLEEQQVQIARNGGVVVYPANFMLVAAMNPCPCGYYPDKNKCRCTQSQIQKYMGHVSGPILDRIDLCVELQPVKISSLQGKERGEKTESSAELRKRVIAARLCQKKRFQGTVYHFNGEVEAADIERFCGLGQEERALMEQLYESLRLSARAYHRILKVARTIADLAGADKITSEHLLEAAYYRPSQDYWYAE